MLTDRYILQIQRLLAVHVLSRVENSVNPREFMERPAATPHIGYYGEPRLQEPPDRRSVRLVHCIPNPDIEYSFDALFNSTNA